MDNQLEDLLKGRRCELAKLPIFRDNEMLEGRMTQGVTILLLVMAICTMVMNFGVILRIYKLIRKGGEIKPPFYFIGNLAVSDFLVGMYVIIMFCIDLSKISSNWRNNCCGLLTAIVVAACQETICSITLIAVDKYIFICHGLTYRTKVTTKRVYISILLSWCYSLLIGLLPTIGLHEPYWCSCSFLLYVSKGFAIILFISAVVIPLSIIVTLYAIILSLAVKVTRSRLRERSRTPSGSTSVIRLSFSSANSSRSNSKISSFSRSASTESAKGKRFRLREIVNAENQEIHGKKEKNPLQKKRRDSDTLSVVEESFERQVSHVSTTPNGATNYKEENVSSDTDTSDSLPTHNGIKMVKRNAKRSYSLSTIEDQPGTNNHPAVALKSYRNFPDEGHKMPTIRVQKSVQINEVIIINRSESITSNNNSTSSQEESEEGSKQHQWVRKSYYKKVVAETKDRVQFLKKCKAIKIIFLIVGLFIVTYVPFVVGTFVFKVKKEPDERLFKTLNNLLYCAVVLNSLINPFIYAYGYQEFRIKTKRFKGILAKERKNSFHDVRKTSVSGK